MVRIFEKRYALLSKYVGKQYLDNTASNDKKLNAFYVQDIRLTYNIQKLLFKFRSNFVVKVSLMVFTFDFMDTPSI